MGGVWYVVLLKGEERVEVHRVDRVPEGEGRKNAAGGAAGGRGTRLVLVGARDFQGDGEKEVAVKAVRIFENDVQNQEIHFAAYLHPEGSVHLYRFVIESSTFCLIFK